MDLRSSVTPPVTMFRANPEMPHAQARRFWASPWNLALCLIAASALLRLIYLIQFTPYQLVGDEAYYWAQSQHLDWSYDEKGPLLAWAIALSCHLFGNVEWAVRLPVFVSSIVAAWAAGRLTLAFTRGSERAALFAVGICLLVPAFQANAQIATQDGLLIPVLIGLTASGLRLIRHWEADGTTPADWITFCALMAVGVLLKQSVLLFGTALIAYVVVRRRFLVWRPRMLLQFGIAAAVFALIVSPMIWWEYRHGWPMLGHTLGHLGVGQGHFANNTKGNPATWLGLTLGGMIGAGGPAFFVLAIWASARAIRCRKLDDSRWHDHLWILCAAWPSIAFFVLLSLLKPVVPSWPLPSLAPLVVIVAALAAQEIGRSTAVTGWWRILVIYGIGGALVIMFPTLLSKLPIVGAKLNKSLVSRLRGNREEAHLVFAAIERSLPFNAARTVVVTQHYMKASLFAFYMPPNDHFIVTTACGYVGARPNNFDNWDDTRLSNPNLLGGNLFLVGGSKDAWAQVIKAQRIDRIEAARPVYLATDFHGRQVRTKPLAAEFSSP